MDICHIFVEKYEGICGQRARTKLTSTYNVFTDYNLLFKGVEQVKI